MPRPMRRLYTLALSLVLLGALAAPARADFNIAAGLKWDPFTYTRPFGVDNGATNLIGFQTTSLNSYVGFYFTEQIGVQLALDFGFANKSADTPGTTGTTNSNTSYVQFGFGLGAKFYLIKPARQKVTPYVFAQFFKYIAAIGTSQQNANTTTNDLSGQTSPIGFDLAFGAEYWFTRNFSLGAEIVGLRFAHVDWSDPVGTGGNASTSYNYFTWYGGFSLNYRFLNQAPATHAHARTYQEEEPRPQPLPQPKPRPRPRPAPEEAEDPDDQ